MTTRPGVLDVSSPGLPRLRIARKTGVTTEEETSTRALLLEYTGGTPCDIEDLKRGATVELTCGTR